jgi:hypothetical protein
MASNSQDSSFEVVINVPATDAISEFSSSQNVISESLLSQTTSSSQTTSLSQTSPSHSEIPAGLELVSRSGGKDKFILYPLTDDAVFQIWWNQTPHGRLLKQQGRKQKWGESRRNSSWWTHFAEGATFPQGRPKIRCKYCSRLLEHPYVKNTGTTAMKNHLKSINCSYRNVQNNNVKELLMQVMVGILKLLILTLVRFITKLLLTYYIGAISVL